MMRLSSAMSHDTCMPVMGQSDVPLAGRRSVAAKTSVVQSADVVA